MYQAIWIEKDDQGYRAALAGLAATQLPDAPVSVKVLYSALNYKDALAISGQAPVIRQFPMVPGIDFAGEVTASTDPRWKAGDQVIVTGYGVGESHPGGLAQRAAVNGDWLVPLPDALTPLMAMAAGTAGFTATLCVMALERQGITPQSGEVLVTGASGGVGSFATLLLAKAGYHVVAVSGRSENHAYLCDTLGASRVLPRESFSQPAKPLAREQWAAAIDTAGSHTLSNVLAGTQRNGVVAACGMAQGLDLPTSVAPFILRGVTLCGVDSVMCPMPLRLQAWQRLASVLTPDLCSQIAEVIPLSQAISTADQLLKGNIRGRRVVDCQQVDASLR